MMYTEIIKLLDAGYSRDEILAMDEPEETKQEETKQEENNTPSAEFMGELKELFSDMKKEFTAMNIMNSRRDNEVKTNDDIIANIINPFERKEK